MVADKEAHLSLASRYIDPVFIAALQALTEALRMCKPTNEG